MTSRQWELLGILKINGVCSLEFLTRVLDYVVDYKGHDKCIELRNDADAINDSVETDKIVLHDNNNNYWLARNAEEAVKFAKTKYAIPASNKFAKYWNIMRKVLLNGQCKLISNKGDVIDSNSKARDFFEAFVEQAYQEFVTSEEVEEDDR